MAAPLRVLLVEDDEDDYLLTRDCLEEIEGEPCALTWVDRYEDGFDVLRGGAVDVCLVDYRIGGRTGLEFIEEAKGQGVAVPMILLTGVGQRDIDVQAAALGAADYLDKSELTSGLLDRAMRFAVSNARAMEALAAERSFLQTTLENTGAAIAAFDTCGTMTTCNRHFEAFIDEYAPELAQRDDGFRIDLPPLKAKLSVEKITTLEITTSAGRVYELRKNEVPKGGYVLFVIDITEQRTIRRDLERARNDAEAASRAKSTFLANISHELRTPLHSVIGYAELIMSGADTLPAADCADQIHESGKHLLALIEAVLSYSKMESGDYECRFERIIELDYVIHSAIDQVGAIAARRAVTIVPSVSSDVVSVKGDPLALRQILVNLLSNAIHFSDEGAAVEVSLVPDGNGAAFVVADTGQGMTEAQVETAFTPFVQGEESLARSHDGTGLGLPIAQGLARHHGGDIEIESAPGEGTTVTVTMPASNVMLADAPKQAASA